MGERSGTLTARLHGGETLVGMQCFTASPVLVEAMGMAGFDFTILDREHCPTGLETVAHLARAAQASGLTPLVRIPELSRIEIGRALDLGVRGVVVPHGNLERCRAALEAARYAPQGKRGACPAVRAAGYLPADWAAFAARENEEILVVPLIEDGEALEQIEQVVALEGIEIVFLGPFDLAQSLGLPGADYRHPTLSAALDRVVAAAAARGKWVMTTVGATIDEDYASLLVERGVRLLSFSADVAVFLAACRRIAALRDGGGEKGST